MRNTTVFVKIERKKRTQHSPEIVLHVSVEVFYHFSWKTAEKFAQRFQCCSVSPFRKLELEQNNEQF